MSRSRPALALAVCGVAGLVGCGHLQTVGGVRVAQIALTEYSLSPAELQARQGPITLVVHDFGRLAHNLTVRSGSRTIAQTPPIQPGTSITLSVYLPPGTYTLASTLFEDESLGIHGTLTVTR